MVDTDGKNKAWFRWERHLGIWQGKVYYDFVPKVATHDQPYYGELHDVTDMMDPDDFLVSLATCCIKFPRPST